MIAYGGNNVANNASIYALEISSATGCEFQLGVAHLQHQTAYYAVIEFKSGVLASASRRGSISLTGATSNTATITDVGTSNQLQILLG